MPHEPTILVRGEELTIRQIADAARRPYRQLFKYLRRKGRISEDEVEGLRRQLREPLILEEEPDPLDVL